MPHRTAADVAAAPRFYTSHEVGRMLGVTPSSVVKWINEGLLQAFRTPGGHRRVGAPELVRFSVRHGMPIPDELRTLAVTRVLVCDDNDRILSALHAAFRPHAEEFQVETSDNGVDALVRLGALQPDVLILDIRMPGLDGFDVLARIKSNPVTAGITVVAVSGRMDAKTTERCQKLGAALCLEKPYGVSDLVKALRGLRKPVAG